MAAHTVPKVNSGNILLRHHPVHRVVFCSLVTALVYFFIRGKFQLLITTMILWDVFSLLYLVFSWNILLKRSVPQIRVKAKSDDGSVTLVFLLVVLSSFAAMITVLLLMLSQSDGKDDLYIPVAVSSMAFAWLMVHTIYSFHYAHMYYDDDEDSPGNDATGLEFPGKGKPDYVDFAYFAFVIGCTFQVSDVEISSKKIRRVALVHGLLSFGLNTFVVALSINIIAGLSK